MRTRRHWSVSRLRREARSGRALHVTSRTSIARSRRTSEMSVQIGRYEVDREIGRGGMAVVYLARQLDLDRAVALKELAGLQAPDASHISRFLREGRLPGSPKHPNLLTGYQ